MNDYMIPDLSQEEIQRLADLLSFISIDEHDNIVVENIVDASQIHIEYMASALAGITDPFGQLEKWIEDFVKSVASWIVETLSGVIDNVVSGLKDFIQSIIKGVSDAVSSVLDTLSSLANTVSSGFQELGNTISSIASSVTEGFSYIVNALESLGSQVLSGFSSIIDAVKGVVETVSSAISNAVKSIMDYIGSVISGLSDLISNIAKDIASIGGAISNIIDTITSSFEGLISLIRSGLTSIVSIGKQIVDALSQTLSAIGSAIGEGISGLADLIKSSIDAIADYISKGFSALVDSLQSIVDRLLESLKDLGKFVSQGFTSLTKGIESFIKSVGEIIDNVRKGFELIGARFTGFINAIMNFPTWFQEYLVKPLLQGLGKLAEPFKPVIDFFTVMGDLIIHPDKLLSILMNNLGYVWSSLSEMGKTIVDTIVGGLSWLADSIKNIVSNLVKWFAGIFTGLIKDLSDFLSGLVNNILTSITAKRSPSIIETLSSPFIDIYSTVSWYADEYAKAIASMDIEEITSKPMAWLYKLLTYGIPALMIYTIIYRVIKAGLKAIPDVEVSGEPLGIGGKIKVSLKAMATELADMLKAAMPDVIRYLIIGHMIWWSEPTRAITRYTLTRTLTIELPPLELTLESVRRRVLSGKLSDLYEFIRTQLRMGGIYEGYISRIYGIDKTITDIFINRLKESNTIFSQPPAPVEPAKFIGSEDLSVGLIMFRDRFYTERYVPTSLIFRLPSPETLARWLVRDIFITPSHYEAVATAVGVFPDIARLQYMYSFEYPPPEKIWKFVMRGISGLLWFNPPEFIQQIFKQEAQWLNAGEPLPPTKLNFEYETLFRALNWYMKWRQYSNFSWFRSDIDRYRIDWTADSWLILDVTADIPGKVDIRWMTKWAILELMSEKGITITTPAQQFVTVLEDNPVNEQVSMDLTLMSRLLQATGLHPYYVPIVAVSEAMDALVDERTYLRTGFIDLFREGFLKYEQLEDLLSNFVIASFKVAYFDMQSYKWVTKWMNVPVRFLPAERKLLELRAVFDRARELLRDFARTIGSGVRYLVLKPGEAILAIIDFVKTMNKEWFADAVKAITGKELELRVDESWLKFYIQYYEKLSTIEKYVRARYYTRYLIYHVIRRFERGYISRDEAVELIKKITNTIRESEIFTELVDLVSETTLQSFIREQYANAIFSRLKRRKISKEEALQELVGLGLPEDVARAMIEAKATPYSISLSSLGTLLELVPEALEYSISSLDLFGLNEDELAYWQIYLLRKPFKDELTLVRTRIYNALAVGVSADVLADILSKYMVKIELKNGKVEYGYGDIAQKLVQFYDQHKEVFRAYGISAPEWVIYNVIAKLINEIDEAKELRKAYLPTPSMLATLSEYISIPLSLVEEALIEKHVPEEWIPLWLQYIRVRPFADEIRTLASAYYSAKRYGVPLGDLEDEIIKILDKYGMTEEERKIRYLSAYVRALIDQWREAQNVYIPTPSMLASIAEVVPSARDLLQDVLERRHVPPEYVDMWVKYVNTRPLIDDIRELYSRAERLYVSFFMKEEDFEEILKALEPFGWEEREQEIRKHAADLYRIYEAFRNLIGSPRTLVSYAEYSPRARELALGQVYKMIDALPVDEDTKKFLKEMWEELIRIRPVYDEVRRYVTELINDYANGIMTYDDLKLELEELKKWGLDDYEIEFYLYLAQKRRLRYEARREMYGGGYIGGY